jgi:putative transposase
MPAPISNDLKLTHHTVRQIAVERLTEYLPLAAEGYTCSTEMLVDVLVKAAATGQTIEEVCKDLERVADSNTIRSYLNEQIRIEDLRNLERQVNRAVVKDIPARVWKGEQEVIFDLNDEAFYGKTPELVASACRGEARDGTTYFFRVATAYVIVQHLRVTLAVLFVTPEDDLQDIVVALRRRLNILGVKVRRLLLDKGFHSIPMMRFLESTGWPVIIACPIKGKHGGLRAKCQGTRTHQTEHTFASADYGTFTAPVTLIHTFLNGKRQRRCWKWLAFVVLNETLTPKQVRRIYRRRFGVESSYRCRRKARARTATRNPALRFLLLGLSFILVNLWLQLRWWYAQVPRRGRRYVDAARFELQRMLNFLSRAIEAVYGVVNSITADAEPLGV